MNYEIIELEEKIVVGKSIKTTNQNEKCIRDINMLWQNFIKTNSIKKIKNKVTGKGIGLYCNYEGDETKPYTFMCCTEVYENQNSDFETRSIPKGRYAKFSIKGHMITAVQEAWTNIYNTKIDRAFTCDFEVYNNDNEDINEQNIDIYISIK